MAELISFVGTEKCEKLNENQIDTILAFLITDSYELAKIIDFSEQEIQNIKLEVSKRIHNPNKIIKVVDILPWRRISTGCKSIDCILRHGIPVARITEIYGNSGVGKTQFCLQLALQVQLRNDLGGLEKGAVYICTEDIFPSKRLHQLSHFFKAKNDLPEQDFESNIFLKHAPDIEQLQRCISVELPILIRRENIGLLVLDSIAGPFRGENEGDYLTRSRDLVAVAHKLNDICEEFNVAVVCTNQVRDDLVNCTTEPCLGIAWSNSLNYRCQISKYNDSLREFKVIFSPDVPRRKSLFSISEEGLESR